MKLKVQYVEFNFDVKFSTLMYPWLKPNVQYSFARYDKDSFWNSTLSFRCIVDLGYINVEFDIFHFQW